jgi:pyochelin biosynthesis protein PchC
VNGDILLRQFHPSSPGGARLVCFPHAGGSASSFHMLSALLEPYAETLVVQYAGRQDRRFESPPGSIAELADQVDLTLRKWPDRPLALFGHSMGALVAYETARRLEKRSAPVEMLFASGRRAPSVHRSETTHGRDDAGLLAELKQLSGTDERLLGDEEILRMILPALRADYAILDAYRYEAGRSLRCPVTALVGDSDPVTSVADAKAWEGHTSGPFELKVFRGGHFFLAEHQVDVASVVSGALRANA